MATTTTMSGAAYDRLSLEESRHSELLHGEVIEVSRPTGRHHLVVKIFLISLDAYFRGKPGGGALQDCEFALGEDTRLCPDVAILRDERWTSADLDRSPIQVPPDIAVEVLSSSERSTDSQRKVWTYLSSGVREVWQVVSEGREVLIYRDSHSFTGLEIDQALSTPLLPGWELSLRELFELAR